MLKQRREKQQQMEIVIMEQVVPENHFLRKVDRAVDFSFIYDLCAPLYCADNGRPAIDPEILFRMLLVGYLYGIKSEARLEEEVNYNIAYKWFCGLDLTPVSYTHLDVYKRQDLEFVEPVVKIRSALSAESREQLEKVAGELCQDYIARSDKTANKKDMTALFRIGYGLYVVTSNDGKKDNGLIVNTVSQVTDSPNRVAVTINKANYSHHVIRQTGIMNVNCLSVDAPFKVFQTFGFQSGRTVDKFAACEAAPGRSDNGLVFLPRYINAFMSLKVENYIDLGSHGMFICSVEEARVINERETMTYTYYQNHVKPKPQTEGKKGFVCKVCGYIYEGDTLPDDFVCPLCKHGAADFEPIA